MIRVGAETHPLQLINPMQQLYPILEFDHAPEALIEPSRVIRAMDIPEHCVVCFFQDVINGLLAANRLKEIAQQKSEIGRHPVYELEHEGRRIAIFHPGIGAPLAVGLLEEVIALGSRKFIACGGAGVLNPEIAVGHIIVPVSAVRDEGTSYHYAPPSREIEATPLAVSAIERVLDRNKCSYIKAKTWTTDAIYRETATKIQQRQSEGCVTVEMEAAAFFAVARFRGAIFGQILYGGDDVSGSVWDSRHWDKHISVRERLFWLAVESCLEIGD